MKNTNPVLSENEVLGIALRTLKTECSKEEFELFKPWSATYSGGSWCVKGTIPEGTKSGTLKIIVSDRDKKVIDVNRMK